MSHDTSSVQLSGDEAAHGWNNWTKRTKILSSYAKLVDILQHKYIIIMLDLWNCSIRYPPACGRLVVVTCQCLSHSHAYQVRGQGFGKTGWWFLQVVCLCAACVIKEVCSFFREVAPQSCTNLNTRSLFKVFVLARRRWLRPVAPLSVSKCWQLWQSRSRLRLCVFVLPASVDLTSKHESAVPSPTCRVAGYFVSCADGGRRPT